MMLAAHDLTLAGRLAGIEAVLRPGEITAICGPNGAGKSSLLACLAGLLGRDGGQIGLDGAQTDRPFGTEAGADDRLSAADAGSRLGHIGGRRWSRWAACRGAMQRRSRSPLRWRRSTSKHFAQRPVSQLSGGERARALLARVLAGEPRWLLADEPLAALDLAHQLALLGTLRRLAAVEGTGVVLVLHDLALAMNHADRVLVLDRGALVADGPPEQALSAATNRAGLGRRGALAGRDRPARAG